MRLFCPSNISPSFHAVMQPYSHTDHLTTSGMLCVSSLLFPHFQSTDANVDQHAQFDSFSPYTPLSATVILLFPPPISFPLSPYSSNESHPGDPRRPAQRIASPPLRHPSRGGASGCRCAAPRTSKASNILPVSVQFSPFFYSACELSPPPAISPPTVLELRPKRQDRRWTVPLLFISSSHIFFSPHPAHSAAAPATRRASLYAAFSSPVLFSRRTPIRRTVTRPCRDTQASPLLLSSPPPLEFSPQPVAFCPPKTLGPSHHRAA
jgi:hypothetical protein